MFLITEQTEDVNVNILTEAKTGEKAYHIEGVFLQGNLKNRNGRIYPMPILEKEVNRYNKEFTSKNRAVGELGHPKNPSINMDLVSHVITELKRDGDNFMGKARILNDNFPNAKIAKGFIQEGIGLGVSSRGMGSVKTNKQGITEVQNDFQLNTAADIVFDPSAPDAFVQGILEGKEWVWDNGGIKEQDVEMIQEQIKKSKMLAEQTALVAFNTFMGSIKPLNLQMYK